MVVVSDNLSESGEHQRPRNEIATVALLLAIKKLLQLGVVGHFAAFFLFVYFSEDCIKSRHKYQS